MADLNCFAFTGRLSKDAEFKTLSSGKKLLQLNVANNVGYGDYAKTNWLTVKMWGDRGENLKPHLSKGTVITASGELTLDEWTDNNGTTHSQLVVTVLNIQMIGGKKEENKPSSPDFGNVPEGEDIAF